MVKCHEKKYPIVSCDEDTRNGGIGIIGRRYSFHLMWREMEEMRAELDTLFHQASSGGRPLQTGGVADQMLPSVRGELRVDVREHSDDVIIVADLPGYEKENVTLQLLTCGHLRSRASAGRRKRRDTKGTMSGNACLIQCGGL